MTGNGARVFAGLDAGGWRRRSPSLRNAPPSRKQGGGTCAPLDNLRCSPPFGHERVQIRAQLPAVAGPRPPLALDRFAVRKPSARTRASVHRLLCGRPGQMAASRRTAYRPERLVVETELVAARPEEFGVRSWPVEFGSWNSDRAKLGRKNWSRR